MNGYSTLPVIYKIIFLSFSTHLTSFSNSQLPSEIFSINLKDYSNVWNEQKEGIERTTAAAMAKKISETKKGLIPEIPSDLSNFSFDSEFPWKNFSFLRGIIGITRVVFYVVFLQWFAGTEVQQLILIFIFFPNLILIYIFSDFPYRAFTVSGKLKPKDIVQATLSSLLNEVVDTVSVTALPSKDSVSKRRRKLEYLEMQEEL
ncbi:hypothetical protein Goari_027079, partial [Gossypium aridum]|nr:hypothetical protein [Gossypium aridum]